MPLTNLSDSFLDKKEILIVEDEILLQKRLSGFLSQLGAEVTCFNNLTETIEYLKQNSPDFALLDINLPDGNGLDLLRNEYFPSPARVVVMTADGGVKCAVEAIKLGAGDYLSKPFDYSELPLVFERCSRSAVNSRMMEHHRKSELNAQDGFFFGTSLAGLQRRLTKIVENDFRIENNLPPVLIRGETGTGKSSIARWIHYHGPRAQNQLIEVNCSTLTDSLAAAELFGYEKGAFTDAKQSKMGLFEAADQGTLFLDEISSLSPAIQAQVLTAIEDRKIRRMGSTKTIEIDIRLITASLKDLKKMIVEGNFREDLYHRLDLLRVEIDPLRNRGSDIVKLAQHFLEAQKKRYGKQTSSISNSGAQNLMAYAWPGNVRELAHEIERSLILEDDGPLHFNNLRVDNLRGPSAFSDSNTLNTDDWLNPNWDIEKYDFDLEKSITRFIQLALSRTDNNVSAAARILKVTRDYIRYRIK